MSRLKRKIARLEKRIATLSAVDAAQLKEENATLLASIDKLSAELFAVYTKHLVPTQPDDATLRAELLEASLLAYCKEKGYDPPGAPPKAPEKKGPEKK